MPQDPPPKPLFILSYRQRDELAAVAVRGGWRPVAARRSDGLDRRLAASGAPVAVIDARGAVAEGLAAMRMLGFAAGAESRALLVLVSRDDAGALGDFYAAGATHFLAGPMSEIELIEALRFAGRFAERVSGGWVAETRTVDALGWQYDHRQRSLQLSPALAALLSLPIDAPPARAAASMGADRPLLRGAVRRLLSVDTTAFAHDLLPVGRVVQHLQRDRGSGRIHALIEPLGDTPDASAAVRDLFPRRSRSLSTLARELPPAIDRGEIEVLFQPQVDIASGAITGVEALARWRHPRLGEVGAEALFAAARRGGRAAALSRHLQDRALTLAAGWPVELGALRLSINVDAADMIADDFPADLLARVDASGIDRERLTIEITEGQLIEELDTAADRLAALRAVGCRVAIDDFGTGYSSLAYLSALPLDYLKLDKAMTHDIVGSERDRVVVHAVIDMAHSLGLAVIAEGVETHGQRDRLAARGCQFYQGYLCSRPIDGDALAALVARGPADA